MTIEPGTVMTRAAHDRWLEQGRRATGAYPKGWADFVGVHNTGLGPENSGCACYGISAPLMSVAQGGARPEIEEVQYPTAREVVRAARSWARELGTYVLVCT
jgi:hypothetical protein